ncbi:hypothetical protein KW805_00520 [Candidatus Pacearchaeota archaeon]|nr:hypothetical protein [Candidatus Pacearchaeota archaeon]
MSEKNGLWTVVLVSLIVAVLATLVTAKLTGNIIKVDPIGKTRTAEVYTKQEVDAKLAGLTNWTVVKGNAIIPPKTGGDAGGKCPKGTYLLNVGCDINGLPTSTFIPDVSILSVGPIYDGGDPMIDFGCAAYNGGTQPANIEGYGICVKSP